MLGLKPIKTLPIREKIAANLREAILSKKIPAGEILTLESTAQELGVSITCLLYTSKKQDSGKEAILAACHSGNIAAGMEYREFTPSAPDQNNCRGYDSSMLPFNGGNLSGVYIMRPDTDK